MTNMWEQTLLGFVCGLADTRQIWTGLSSIGQVEGLPHVIELCEEFESMQEPNMPLNNLRSRSHKLLTLQTRLKALEMSSEPVTTEAIRSIATEITEADEDISEWTETLPEEWYCSIAPFEEVTAGGDDTCSDHALIYGSIWIGTFWNGYRSLRIFANSLLHRCQALLDKIETDSTPMDFGNKPDPRELAEDIFASVPFYLGYAGNGGRKFPSREHVGRRPAMIVCAYQLLWPLYIAAGVETVPLEKRQWAARRLKYIGQNTGLCQAVSLSEQLGVL